MAKEDISAETLLAFEDQLQQIASRLREIRLSLADSDLESFRANVGTLRHTIERMDEFALKMASEYAIVHNTNEVRQKIRPKKTS